MDYLSLLPTARHQEIAALLEEKQQWLHQPKKGLLRYREPYEAVRHLCASGCDFSSDMVTIGTPHDLAPDDQAKVYQVLRGFMPWRKGPFKVFGIEIDAEWRSDRKWQRLAPRLPDLKGKIIADIGCNNGYYMFRMAAHNPALVMGFEPFPQHYYAFKTLNSFAGCNNLALELLGVEHLNLFSRCFDLVFLMGIIYHRQSPLTVLRDIFEALKPGGMIIVESQAIPGTEPVALFPESTFAKVPGTWFVPTGKCLCNWLLRTGFHEVSLFCQHPMSSAEQRRTPWMTFESYDDFIDKERPHLTIEGYPAPWRVFISATKR